MCWCFNAVLATQHDDRLQHGPGNAGSGGVARERCRPATGRGTAQSVGGREGLPLPATVSVHQHTAFPASAVVGCYLLEKRDRKVLETDKNQCYY